jgi:hypothetical protein
VSKYFVVVVETYFIMQPFESFCKALHPKAKNMLKYYLLMWTVKGMDIGFCIMVAWDYVVGSDFDKL